MTKLVLISGFIGYALSVCFIKPVRNQFKQFFTLEAHPLDLALFRIAVFSSLFLTGLWTNPLLYNQIPKELLSPPIGFNWAPAYLPMDGNLLMVLYVFFLLSCVFGIIGFLTRTSAVSATVLGVFLMGISQMYGKVHHDHNLFWFSAILAVSRPADVLSVDSIFQSFSRADQGDIKPPGRSRIYGLPISFVVLLIGIIYFFPGFWKLWGNGIEWFLGDNLKWQLQWKWVEYPDWTPFFRLDRYPALLRLSGFATVVFEISFLLLLPILRLRSWLGVAGLMFHGMTGLFMQIPFWHLQTCYVVFFNWKKILDRIGKVLFPKIIYVVYDGNCKLCRRTMAMLRVLDIFERIAYVNALDTNALRQHPLDWLDHDSLLKDMHAVRGHKIWKGYDAYRALFWYVPVLWPFLPLLYLLPIQFVGERLYRWVADQRTCSVREMQPETEGIPVEEKKKPHQHFQTYPIMIVGVFLVSVNALFGILDYHSWPFSVYPTFETMPGSEREAVLIEAYHPDGRMVTPNKKLFRKKVTSSRWQAFLANGLKIKGQEKQRNYLKALWRFCIAHDDKLQGAIKVRFYEVVLTGDPDRRRSNPISQKLLFEWDEPN